jgi:hypothetical protein
LGSGNVVQFAPPAEIEENVRLFALELPPTLWRALRDEGLIDSRTSCTGWMSHGMDRSEPAQSDGRRACTKLGRCSHR